MELTKNELAQRLLSAAGQAEHWEEVMVSVALLRGAVKMLRVIPRAVCANCNGTGHNPGSDYLDCAAPGCTAAADRVALALFVGGLPSNMDLADKVFAMDQRARQQEREAIAAQAAPVAQTDDGLPPIPKADGEIAGVRYFNLYTLREYGRAARQAAPVVAASELSDEQITAIADKFWECISCKFDELGFARAIMAATSPTPDLLRAAVELSSQRTHENVQKCADQMGLGVDIGYQQNDEFTARIIAEARAVLAAATPAASELEAEVTALRQAAPGDPVWRTTETKDGSRKLAEPFYVHNPHYIAVHNEWKWEQVAPLPPAAAPAVPGELPKPAFTQHRMGADDVDYFTADQMREYRAAAPAPESQPADERALFEVWLDRGVSPEIRWTYRALSTDLEMERMWAAFQAGYRAASAPVPAAQDGWQPLSRVTLQGSSHPVEVFAEPCLVGEFAPHTFALHHSLCDDMLNLCEFSVTHIETGWRAGRGESAEEAIARARKNLASVSRDEFAKRCQDAKAGIAPPIARVAAPVSTEADHG